MNKKAKQNGGILRRLSPYMRPYRWQATLACLLILLEVFFDLLQPVLMMNIVNEGVLESNMSLILLYGGIMVGIALIGATCGLGCIYFSSIASVGFATDLRRDTFYKIQEFSFEGIDGFGVPSLITRLTNDITQIQNIVIMILRTFVRAPFLAVGGIIITLCISPTLSSVLLISLPVLALLLVWILRRAVPRFSRMQARLDDVNTVMRENLSGMRVLKVFARQSYEKQRFDAANVAFTDASLKASRMLIVVMPVLMMVVNMSIIAMLYMSGHLAGAGSIHSGSVIAFINYLMQILSSLMQIGFMFIHLSRAKVSAVRVGEVLDQEIDIVQKQDGYAPRKVCPRIEFCGVGFRYPGAKGRPVLKDVSLHIPAGSVLAIVGATGSGKSTLLQLLARYYDVTQGSILFDGVDVRDWKLQPLRGCISAVLQQSVLFSGTILENLLWGNPEASRHEIEQATKAAQIHSFIEGLGDGYQTVLGQKGINLSGGQKQRLCIARALLRKAPVLLLDDATSAVDVATEAAIHAALKTYYPGTTVLMVAQRISATQAADSILVLCDGAVAAMGTREQLLRESQAFREIYRSQLDGEEGQNGADA